MLGQLHRRRRDADDDHERHEQLRRRRRRGCRRPRSGRARGPSCPRGRRTRCSPSTTRSCRRRSRRSPRSASRTQNCVAVRSARASQPLGTTIATSSVGISSSDGADRRPRAARRTAAPRTCRGSAAPSRPGSAPPSARTAPTSDSVMPTLPRLITTIVHSTQTLKPRCSAKIENDEVLARRSACPVVLPELLVLGIPVVDPASPCVACVLIGPSRVGSCAGQGMAGRARPTTPASQRFARPLSPRVET